MSCQTGARRDGKERAARMECPKCKQQNLPGSSYCEKCGFHLKSLQRQAPRSINNPYAEPGPSVRPSPAPAPRPNYPSAPAPTPPPPPKPPPPKPPPPPPPRRQPPPPPPAARVAQPPPPPPKPVVPPAYAHLRELPGGRQLPLIWDRSLAGRPTDQFVPEIDLSVFGDTSGVSRRHAQILRSQGQVILEDMNSSNGTFLNGVRLQPGLQHPLTHQDEIRFGSLRFQYWQS